MKTIDRYLTIHFFVPFFICAIALIGLVFFIDSAEKFRAIVLYLETNADKKNIIFTYFISSITNYFFSFLPYLLSLTCAIMYINLNKTGQLKAMYSLGLTKNRVFLFPRLYVLLLALALLVMNFSVLPNARWVSEGSSRTIRGLPMSMNAFINEESLTYQQLGKEITAYSTQQEGSLDVLPPPTSQIVYYSETVGDAKFKKVIITRLDAFKKLRQRIVLKEAHVENGFIVGQSGFVQDYYSNGDLYQESMATNVTPTRFATSLYGHKLVEKMIFFYSPDKTSLASLLDNYRLKPAREEFYQRLISPIKYFVLFILSLAISSWLDLKKIYMSFIVLLSIVIIDYAADGLLRTLISSEASIVAILLSPLLIWMLARAITAKANI